MNRSLGRVVARLAEPNEPLPPDIINLINENVRPPEALTADEVHVRAMYIVSDRVNSFGGRFPVDEHARLAELLIDAPVLVGHRKDKLPVGRNFHAVTLERNDRPWVKCYFYWLRSAEGADQLRDNIDGGIYKECSIAFTFGRPQCSICGRDIRRCDHEPFETYQTGETTLECHFEYREIERVLETSLVYRGAVPNTAVTKDLGADAGRCRTIDIDNLDRLDPDQSYLVVPRYDGLPVTAGVDDCTMIVARLDGTPIPLPPSATRLPTGFRPPEPVRGMLVGYRGRERCSLGHLEQYLIDQSGPVSRLALNLYPDPSLSTLARGNTRSRFDTWPMPYRLASREELAVRAREIMTRDGVEIWPLISVGGESSRLMAGYTYKPHDPAASDDCRYTLCVRPEATSATLKLSGEGIAEQTLELAAFDLSRWRLGRRFVARPTAGQPKLPGAADGHSFRGRLERVERCGDSLTFDAGGELAGRLVLRPARLHGHDCHLFYRLDTAGRPGGMK